MGDYKAFKRGMAFASPDSASEKISIAAKKALGLSTPVDDDEEEKKRRMRDAISKRAQFFSDTTGDGE